MAIYLVFLGAPGRNRTYDLRFRKPLLYPTELRERVALEPVDRLPTRVQRGWNWPGHTGGMILDALAAPALRIGALLRERGATVAVAEGSAGGLISAALLSVPGASAYYLGGVVVYTPAAYRAWMAGAVEAPGRLRGATEDFALHLARSAAVKLGATWGIGEAGAAGPSNPYGDPAGHCWVAVASTAGPTDVTRHLLTGNDDRPANMAMFAAAALELLAETLEAAHS
jgi:nicotinamide-nucleotide amidase